MNEINQNTGNLSSIKVMEEQVYVDKAVVETGSVQIAKKVYEEDQKVNVTTGNERLQIETISINKYVAEAPAIRHEGNTMIIPVIHEVAVVEKKLLLVEEVRITKYITESTQEITVPLQKEEVIFDRQPGR